MVTREYEVTGFTGIDAGSAFEIEVTQGSDFAVAVTAEESTFRYIEVDKDGHNLRLRLNHTGIFSFGRATLRARITMPALESLHLSGATSCELKPFSADDVTADISGASKLTGELQASRLTFDVSGASTVDLEGTADTADAEVSGASTLDLRDTPVEVAEVELSGASTARLDVSERLGYDLSGASTLRYTGTPDITSSDVSGASHVEHD